MTDKIIVNLTTEALEVNGEPTGEYGVSCFDPFGKGRWDRKNALGIFSTQNEADAFVSLMSRTHVLVWFREANDGHYILDCSTPKPVHFQTMKEMCEFLQTVINATRR